MLSIVRRGSIFDSECETLVCPVNCVGIMGKGLALSFKMLFPNMFRYYKSLCTSNILKAGKPAPFIRSDKPNILLFPTKNHWKDPSNLEWITLGLKKLSKPYPEWHTGFNIDSKRKSEYFFLKSVAFPALGCGCGGLSWDVVKPVMLNYLRPAKVDIEIYAPYGR